MLGLLYVLVNAIALRTEGGGAPAVLPSTFLARLIPTLVVALLTGLILHWKVYFTCGLWVLLFCAKVWAINPYSQIAMDGNTANIGQKNFPPADWIMAKLNLRTDTVLRAKVWGLVATAIRTSLWAVPIVFLAVMSGHPFRAAAGIAAPVMAFGYFLGGFIPATDKRIASELLAGAILGTGLLLAMGG